MPTLTVRTYKNDEGFHFCGNLRHVTLLTKAYPGGSNLRAHYCYGNHEGAEELVSTKLRRLALQMPKVFEAMELVLVPEKCLVVNELLEGKAASFQIFKAGEVVSKKWHCLKPGDSVKVDKTILTRNGKPFETVFRINNCDGDPLETDTKQEERASFAKSRVEELQKRGLSPHFVHKLTKLVTVTDSLYVVEWLDEVLKQARLHFGGNE